MTGQKYCVVLGASGGIGDAISRTLAAAGWSLFLHYNENAAHANLLQQELSMQHIHNRIFKQSKQISVHKTEQNYSSNKFEMFVLSLLRMGNR